MSSSKVSGTLLHRCLTPSTIERASMSSAIRIRWTIPKISPQSGAGGIGLCATIGGITARSSCWSRGGDRGGHQLWQRLGVGRGGLIMAGGDVAVVAADRLRSQCERFQYQALGPDAGGDVARVARYQVRRDGAVLLPTAEKTPVDAFRASLSLSASRDDC